MTRLTLEDLRPVAEVLEMHGFQQIAQDRAPERYAWQGLTVLGRGLGLLGEDRRVVITCQGTLIIREPGEQIAWRQTRYIECGEDAAAMVDELVNARILTWGYHTAAATSSAATLDALVNGEAYFLTAHGLAVLAEGVASGA